MASREASWSPTRERGGSHDGINSPLRGRVSAPGSSTSLGDLDGVGVTSEGSLDAQDDMISFGPCRGGMSRDVGRSKSAYYYEDYVYPSRSLENSRGPAATPASVQELQLRREGLLRDYKEVQLQRERLRQKKQEIRDQLSDLNDALDAAEAFSDHNNFHLSVEVYVNGQAITSRSIKKAEKFAGPIEAGEYWYDAKAGFWGVMGGRCLGIIPPCIQQFSSPIAENCSKGDSAVYVNGRELPKEDLDLLSARGLPTTKDKHYFVYISGQVFADETEDFVVNLGRLAPTVEKRKCGFGMYAQIRAATW